MYTIDKLTEELEHLKYYLEDEQKRHDATDDEHLKGLLSVRINMWQRNIEDLTKAIATFEDTPNATP